MQDLENFIVFLKCFIRQHNILFLITIVVLVLRMPHPIQQFHIIPNSFDDFALHHYDPDQHQHRHHHHHHHSNQYQKDGGKDVDVDDDDDVDATVHSAFSGNFENSVQNSWQARLFANSNHYMLLIAVYQNKTTHIDTTNYEKHCC